ncbi:MAG: two-component system response regulator [Chloroflexi bacterium HGW-Chloroflexi-10]|nr:MAG: two-component system response regulator [Chloroflexi bacterium HGW-Chloroflexi-10]
MNNTFKGKTILLVEDDPDDIYLIGEAIDECKMDVRLNIVQDGEELLEFLTRTGNYAEENQSPRPDLIILDLNMPRKDGREALEEIKAIPELRSIPVVVLTTSKADEDLDRCYRLGASGFITKPVKFKDLKETVCKIGSYWLDTVLLPEETDQEKKEET